jgi:hypothetical protein
MNAGTPPPSLRPYRPRRFPDLVRIGSAYDGGYVLPESAIRASSALLSLGVEANWEFEQAALAINPALRVTCVDGTTGPKVIRARARREMGRALVRLRPVKFARMLRLYGQARAFRRFFAQHEFLPLMVGPTPGPGAATVTDLLDHVRRGDAQRWVTVKMDIEGAEYDSLAAASGRLGRVAALAIEFHELEAKWLRFRAAMDSLAGDFVVAHVHGNNHHGYVPGTQVPQTLEITLIHRELAPATLPAATDAYPLPRLDRANDRRRPDLILNFE